MTHWKIDLTVQLAKISEMNMEKKRKVTVAIRRVAQRYKEEWLRMRKALWPGCSIDMHLSEMAEQLADESDSAIFVAVRLGGGLGGFIEISIRSFAEGCDTRPVGYIEGWYVDADLRHQGIGSQLVREAEAWVISQGYKEMASDCLIDNAVSLKAHVALGYKETDRLIHFKKVLNPDK